MKNDWTIEARSVFTANGKLSRRCEEGLGMNMVHGRAYIHSLQSARPVN